MMRYWADERSSKRHEDKAQLFLEMRRNRWLHVGAMYYQQEYSILTTEKSIYPYSMLAAQKCHIEQKYGWTACLAISIKKDGLEAFHGVVMDWARKYLEIDEISVPDGDVQVCRATQQDIDSLDK